VLFHGVSSAVGGKIGEMEDELQLLRDLDLVMAGIVGPRLGMTPQEYLKRIDRLDWWLTANEALQVRALDGVIDTSLPPPTAESSKVEQPAAAVAPVAPAPLPCPPPTPLDLRPLLLWLWAHAEDAWLLSLSACFVAVLLKLRKRVKKSR